VTKQANAGVEVAEALRKGDRELTTRVAHTAKGVAGNLGIGQVQTAAEKVERAIRQNAPVEAGIEELNASLGRMVEAIQRRVPLRDRRSARLSGSSIPSERRQRSQNYENLSL